MTADDGTWTIEDHLRTGSDDTNALFEKIRAIVESFGPGTISVSKSSVTFKGTRRGFAGARPTAKTVVGYLDLMRVLPADPRITSSSPYGRNLVVHHYVLHDESELDAEFISWLHEAYEVGCGAHLRRPSAS
jgi:hypothetical protein